MRSAASFACAVAAAALIGVAPADARQLDRRQIEQAEQRLRQEGRAVVALADAADDTPPADFLVHWHNDFLKAQSDTFVPFVVSIDARGAAVESVLLYVRVAPRGAGRTGERRAADAGLASYPFEEIYPVPLGASYPVRVTRGFTVPAGAYDLTLVVRERETPADARRRRRAAVLRRSLDVPDFTGAGLSASTLILADALTPLHGTSSPGELAERPYIVGSQEIHVAADTLFGPAEELIVVFLVYNPAATPEKDFDLEVEYHFVRQNQEGSGGPPQAPPQGLALLPGERYFNRTEPQRFNRESLGGGFDPGAGQPVMAGQGVPLAGFPDGDYRLVVKVNDLVARRGLEREVTFTVRR